MRFIWMTEGIIFHFWFLLLLPCLSLFEQNLCSFFQPLHIIPIALPNTAEFSMLYECRASSAEALRTAMVQLWRFIMHNCSTGEGSTKDETNLECLPIEGTQKAVPQ